LNIFVLDINPEIAAQFHCDKHVVKMILESAQLLSTCHQILDGKNDIFYKSTHINHPCNKWVRESSENYKWLYSLFYYLCKEYQYRYNKIHLTESKLLQILSNLPKNIKHYTLTEFSLCMPENCKINNDVVESYRNYYIKQKLFAKWNRNREKPFWYK